MTVWPRVTVPSAASDRVKSGTKGDVSRASRTVPASAEEVWRRIGLAGGDTGEVMLGVAAATAASVALSLVPLRSLLATAAGAMRRRLATRWNAGAAAGLTASMALATDDLLVAKLSFRSHQAGVYAAASVGSRVLLLTGIAVVTALALGLLFLASAIRVALSKSNQHARQLLLVSVFYLPLLFGVMVLDR